MKLSKKSYEILNRVKAPTIYDVLSQSSGGIFNPNLALAHNSESQEDVEGLDKLCEMILIDLRDNLSRDDRYKGVHIPTKEEILEFENFVQEHYYGNKVIAPYYHYMLHHELSIYGNNCPRNFVFQKAKGVDSILSKECKNGRGYLHLIYSSGNIDARLYLNLKKDNICKFAIEAFKRCRERNFPFYMKFTMQDNRNDPALFYTSYESFPDTLGLIEEIKRDRPELFEGTEDIASNYGNLDGYIGYGDEPKKYNSKNAKNRTSYNGVLRRAVSSITDRLNAMLLTKYRKKNKSKYIDNLNFDEYLEKLITELVDQNIPDDYKQRDRKKLIASVKDMLEVKLKGYALDCDLDNQINDTEIQGVTLPFMSSKLLNKLYNDDSLDELSFRGQLLRHLQFSDSRDDDKLLEIIGNLVREDISSTLDSKNLTPNDKENLTYILDRLNTPDLDNNRSSLKYILAANFLNNGTLKIKTNDFAYKFNCPVMDIYEKFLKKEKIEKTINSVCKKNYINPNNCCFSNETIDAMRKANKNMGRDID